VHLGYVILYVDDVRRALEFYEEAFGFDRKFLHDSGDFGQLESGSTSLAFTSHSLGRAVVPQGYRPVTKEDKPVGIEFTLVTPTVDEAFDRAVAAGATALSDPHDEPWGQRVSYVRDPFGALIGIASPMA
jgi:lactoylglutathione lyase